jgi:hypothetical protein
MTSTEAAPLLEAALQFLKQFGTSTWAVVFWPAFIYGFNLFLIVQLNHFHLI